MLSFVPGESLRFYQGLTADEYLLSAKWISAKDILEVALVQPYCSWIMLAPVSIRQHHLRALELRKKWHFPGHARLPPLGKQKRSWSVSCTGLQSFA